MSIAVDSAEIDLDGAGPQIPYDMPMWVAYRGGDCRGYDRSAEREVYGPGHPFLKCTDLLITNGLIRAWPGSRGDRPYLNVSGYDGTRWHESGVLYLAESDANKLLAARLVSVSPDALTMALTVAGMGDVFVSIVRARRALIIQHGVTGSPVAVRSCRWASTPPADSLGDTRVGGVFDGAMRQSTGDDEASLRFPRVISPDRWSIAYRWLPTAASGAQPSSGIGRVQDANGNTVFSADWSATDQKIRMTMGVGPSVATSSPIAFAAGAPVFVCFRFSVDGFGLAVRPPGGANLEVVARQPWSAPAAAPNTLEFLGEGPGTWGGGTWGGGTWGGGIATDAAIDNVEFFDADITDEQVASLAGAVTGQGGLTGFEGNLVGLFPFDLDPVMASFNLTRAGLVTEPGAGTDGFSRVVAALDATVTRVPTGFETTGAQVRFAAGLAAPADAPTDIQTALAAATEQETRVR